jgi:hypothetical protein
VLDTLCSVVFNGDMTSTPIWNANIHYHDQWFEHCDDEGLDPNDEDAREDWLIGLAEEADQRRYEAFHGG